MNTLTHNLLANYQYHFPYDHRSISGLLQQKYTRRLSFQGPARPSFCPLTGLDSTNSSTFLNPYLQAGYICSSDDEDTRNSTTAARQQIITYVDGSYIDLNCTDDDNGGNVTLESLSCLDADRFYRHEADTDDLEMLSSWWSPNCCFTTDDIRNLRWDALQEHRESFFGRISIILIGVTSIISIICSSTFIWMLRRSRDGLSTSKNRVLLGLCVSDIIYSSQYLPFGMFAPKELDYVSWNARGNMATCHIAGFLSAIGSLLGPLYNASLCVLLLSIVKYEKSDEYIRDKIEPFLHAVPWLISFGSYILSLVVGNINPNGTGSCSPGLYSNPPLCYGMKNRSIIEGVFPDIPCGRGGSESRFIRASYLILIIIPPIVMMTCLAMIYRCVRITEQKMSRYGSSSFLKNETSTASLGILGLLKQCHLLSCSSCKKGNPVVGSRARQERTTKTSNSRLVMYKGVAYSCSWLLTWGLVLIINFVASIGATPPLPIIYVAYVFLPLQGLFNLTIYMHPKILAAKKSKRENLSWWKAFVKAFWSKGAGKKKMKGGGGRSGPTRRIGAKTRSYEFNSNKMKGSNGINGTVETRSLRSKSQRSTKCGDEEEKQEIEAPWNAPCLAVGRRSDNPTPLIPLHKLVLDVVVEDSKNKCVDVNKYDPDTISEASIASEGKVLELIEPTTEEGSSHSVLCIGNDGMYEFP